MITWILIISFTIIFVVAIYLEISIRFEKEVTYKYFNTKSERLERVNKIMLVIIYLYVMIGAFIYYAYTKTEWIDPKYIEI